jgi:Fe-S-cluster containining protein
MATCCQTSEIYVTLGDVRRIEEHTGQTNLTEWRTPDDPIYLQQHDDPVWAERVLQADGTRRVLKRQPNGDCQFLGSAGCRLPLEVRPLICRLYPFDYNEQGIFESLANGCPLELLRPGQTLLQELEMNRADADRWHQQLYSEVRVEPPKQGHGP